MEVPPFSTFPSSLLSSLLALSLPSLLDDDAAYRRNRSPCVTDEGAEWEALACAKTRSVASDSAFLVGYDSCDGHTINAHIMIEMNDVTGVHYVRQMRRNSRA